jgi:predicted acetyltransferase
MHLVLRDTSGPLPTSSFNLVGDAGEVIGFAQLRHRPSCNDDLPPEASNNIYYEIAETHRGQGHGKALFARRPRAMRKRCAKLRSAICGRPGRQS